MKTITKNFLVMAVAVSLLFLVMGEAQGASSLEYVKMEKTLNPEILAVDGKPKLIPGGFLHRRLRMGIPNLQTLVINDQQYIYVTQHWMKAILEWTEEFIEKQLPEGTIKNNPPVDYLITFHGLANSMANLSVAKRYDVKASVLLGILVAECKEPWGKIPGDGKKRRFLTGLTEKGGLIYDPLTRQLIEFEGFPNYDSIIAIMF